MRTQLPYDGQTRIKTWFALLPVEIGYERRWLERVTVEQTFRDGFDLFDGWWTNVRFVELAAPKETQP